jgi:RNA polymerase sigma factor (sigma-70 family)
MGGTIPIELSQLLGASDVANREAAWEKLISSHTRLLMSIAKSFGGDHDDVMERYSFILEKLRFAEFRRLRSYDKSAGASFSTWLTVTARNLCLDLHRAQFGRVRPEHRSDPSTALRAARRALTELTEGDTPSETLPDLTQPADVLTMQHDLNLCLRDAIGRLTPRQRLLITLRFEDGLPASRIARVVGLASPFHVYRQLNAILDELRRVLVSQGIDGPEG